MNEYITSSVTAVDPSLLFSDGFELSDQNIIPSSDFTGSFVQSENLVEFHIYDASVNRIYSDYNFTGWTNSNQNTDAEADGATDTIVLTPDQDILKEGYQNGTLYAVYNFINLELNSSWDNRYFISQISSDRTEIALQSNFIESSETAASFASLKQKIDEAEYFDEFYLSFGNNEYVIGVNLDIIEDEDSLSILIKLYEPLPNEYELKDEVYVTTKVGETQSYRVEFIEDYSSLLDNANYIKGPNVNIELQDLVNNSTVLKSKSELLDTTSSQSLDKLTEILNQKGVVITPNYSYNTFNEFVNFSSAKSRINNFVEKVNSIQTYQADIDALVDTTGSNPNVNEISSSIASLETNIQNIIKNFDGFESYQYYESSSFAYPKTGSAYPYSLKSTTDTEVLEWLGSDIESSQYYGGYRLSASLYDENNQNWLYYTIPDFIKENSDNSQYLEFSNMVGQHFDEIWLYTKALSERFNTTNDPDSGLPLGLAEEAVKGLGFPSFGNNYNNQDNFIGLTGEDNGSYVPPTGSELITQYIAVNNGSVVNYWNLAYSYLNYVEQLDDPGFPYAIDKVSKEIFKRLYHNMAYLTKKKGTISGLRQLINIWGIPNTILRINEFGGKNKDNSDDYDLWYNRYSLAYTPVATQNVASSSVRIPWQPLERNRIADGEYIVPDGFAFRFKTTGYPSSSYDGEFFTQSLAAKKSNGTENNKVDFSVVLSYTPKTSGSYSGSVNPDDQDYGELQFQLLGDAIEGGAISSTAISLPFFDKGWWSVLVQRDQHVSASDHDNDTTYTIYAKNKQYNGYDGNSIGWEGSASFTVDGSTSSSLNESWNDFGTTNVDGLYLGGYISGSVVSTNLIAPSFGKIFSGSLQEFRYYSNEIAEEVFNDFVMNPESIEGNNITGSEASFDIVNFRAPLGNELEHIFTASVSESFTEAIGSLHPAISGSSTGVTTGSFVTPSTNAVTSSYDFIGYENITTRTYSKPNREVYFLDQPSIGIRNRVSNKIQVEDGDAYGDILSREISIDQDYQISRSYTEDITSLEVAFSPQDEVNDDIIQTFGYGVVSDALADPRHLSSSDSYYPRLRSIAEDYFKKYTKGNIYDYLRLIKYFDNSIFKAIKSYVPARTSVTTGVVIKQHMLERNRRPPVNLDPTTKVAINSSSSFNEAIEFGNLEITSSIPVGTFSGGPGGVVDDFNNSYGNGTLLGYQNAKAYFININTGASTLLNSFGYTAVDANYGTVFTSSNSLLANKPLVGAVDARLYPIHNSGSVPIYFDLLIEGTLYGNNLTNGDFYIFSDLRHTTSSQKMVDKIEAGALYSQSLPNSSIGDSLTISASNLEILPGESIVFSLVEDNDTSSEYVSCSVSIIQSDSGSFKYNSQGYNLINKTVLGSIVEPESSQREFYNGEYSGSEFIATSQSLFDNPYSSQQLTDTSYNIGRVFSGWSDARGTGGGQFVKIYYNEDSDLPKITPDELGVFTSWSSGEWVKIFLGKNINLPDRLYVAAIIFRKKTGSGGYPYIDIDPGIYPSSSAGMDRGEGGTWFWYSGSADVPNFFIDLPAPDQGSITFAQPNAFNTPSNEIWSIGLKPDTGDNQAAKGETNDGSGVWFRFDNEANGAGETSRYISGQGDPNYTTVGWTTSDGNLKAINVGEIMYLSLNEAYDKVESSPVGTGNVSVHSFPLTFVTTGSLGGIFVSSSVTVGIGANVIDDNGNDNTNTLTNLPSYQFEMTTPGDVPVWVQNNVSSSVIRSSDLPLRNITNESGVVRYTFKSNGTKTFTDYQKSHLTFTGNTYIPFNPVLPSDFNFDNSDFNALFNNVTASRANSKIELIDYGNGITTPANLDQIISGSAQKADTPDSNYTQKSRTLPRYEGSKLESLDYNNYTGEGSYTASNGDVIDWGGDSSYGNKAVIDSHPIYFAHFKKSYHNIPLPNTFTFEIDSLIVSPQEDITGTDITPTTIKVEGSNDLLFPVKSTFEVNRQTAIAYDKSNFIAPDGSAFDFSKLKIGSSKIFQGGLEISPIIGNFTEIYGLNSDFINPNFQPTMSFISASWITNFTRSSANTGNQSVPIGGVYMVGDAAVLRCTQSAATIDTRGFLITSSEGFYLGGGWSSFEAPTVPQEDAANGQSTFFWGPGLGLLNSINTQISNSAIFDQAATGYIMGLPSYSGDIPPKSIVDTDLNQSYFRFNFTGSEIPGIVNSNEPFIIKKGDEIVVSWNAGKGTGPKANYFTQVFQVIDITGSVNVGFRAIDYEGSNLAFGNRKIKEESLHNHIYTSPKPNDVFGMDSQIDSFTIRRRINADDRVIIYQTPPSGAVSIEQATEGGFLIPNDFTDQQKRNALTLINQLKEKNSFTQDNVTR